MINLMKMNVYRLLHTKSMYVVLFSMLVICGVSTYMSTLEAEDISERLEQSGLNDSGAITITEADESAFGIYVVEPETEDGKPASFLQHFCADIGSGLLLIFFTIAASLFFYAEEKSGFVKNISGQTQYKANIYLSKIIPLCGYFAVCMLCYGLVEFACLKYFYGSELLFGMEYFGKALTITGIQFLLHIAFLSGVMLLAAVCKSTAVSITVGILTACGFGSILTGFFQRLFDIDVNPYLLHTNINQLRWDTARGDMLHAVGIGIAFFLVYNLAGTAWFVKKDVV